ncbi:uncharacterized protein LOC131290747 [Anopheles ziemanni]|nr:uncharacterized protein LOC131290747 [Anopheles ziemanni]
MIAADRPLSLYDNLTSPSVLANGGGTAGRVIQFPDIQFRFDESIPDRRSVHSSAKSDFFGLHPTPSTSQPAAIITADPPPSTQLTDGHRCSPTPAGPPDPNRSSASPAHDASGGGGGASVSSASPTSTSSTVPAQLSPVAIVDSPRDSYATTDPLGSTSTPRSSRPSSTIKTITIKLPDTTTGVGPSEAVYMTTTVPQNFTKNTNTLIGRHKPTRNSLRHSRMLVANKTVLQRYPRGNSLNLRYVRLSKVLMVLQIVVGLALSLVGLAITIWSPSMQTKDNPYWSGIVLILCGTMFLLLFEFKRGRHMSPKGAAAHHQQQQQASHPVQHRWRESCFHFLHVNALVVLLLTIFFTMLAFIYALIHTTNLSSAGLRCEPQFPFNVNTSSCVCTIDTAATKGTVHPPAANTEPSHPVPGNGTSSPDDGVIRLEYRDFSCDEVHGIWYYVTITSTLLNSAGCLLAATFLVIYAIDCIRRPENDSPRLVACRLQPTGGDLAARAINGRTAGGTTTAEDRHGVEEGATMPLLQNLPTATHPPPAAVAHEPNEGANTSVRSINTTMAEHQLTEENTTLTTILSADGELDNPLPSS